MDLGDIVKSLVESTAKAVETGAKSVMSLNFDVYLTNVKDNDKLHFPVNPLSLTVNHEKKYTTADIIDIGEVDINDKGTKIKEIAIETLIPDVWEPYCRYTDIPNANDTIEKLWKWQDRTDPLRLIITGIGFNDLVNLANISEEVKPEGLYNGKYFTFTFRTYKELKITKVDTTLKSSRAASTASSGSGYSHHVGEWIYITADSLNVRDEPNNTSGIRGTVNKGECYKIGRVQGNYADIYWSNHGGWVDCTYVR